MVRVSSSRKLKRRSRPVKSIWLFIRSKIFQHSLTSGLRQLPAIPERADPRDALLCPEWLQMHTLPVRRAHRYHVAAPHRAASCAQS